MRTPTLLTPTTTEHVLLLSGREEALPKTTPRFPKWTGEFPWSTYGGKPILDFRGEPLYAEFVILGLLETEGWSGVWVNSVHRRPFPRRWPPSPIMILPPKVYALHHECLRIVALIALGRVPRIELIASRAIYRVESFRIVGPCTMHVRLGDEAEQTVDLDDTGRRGKRLLRDIRLFEQIRVDPEVHTIFGRMARTSTRRLYSTARPTFSHESSLSARKP